MKTSPSTMVASRCTRAGSLPIAPLPDLADIRRGPSSRDVGHYFGGQKLHRCHHVAMGSPEAHVEDELVDAELCVAVELVDKHANLRNEERFLHIGERSSADVRYDRALDHLSVTGAQVVMALVVAGSQQNLLIDLCPICASKSHAKYR